jgi:hypothetical protein
MSEPQTTEPATIRAGDAVSWTRDLPQYLPADGWTLKYRLLWRAAPAAAISSAAYNTTLHLVALTAADTAAFQAGRATMVGWVERTVADVDERVTLSQLQVEVLPDLTTATSLDGRSANERALADARAALAAYAAGGQAMVEEYQILGRRMKFRDVAQVHALIQHYEREVAKDQARAAALQGFAPGRIYTRF